MTELADAAFREAAKDVIKRAEDTGTPVIIWEKGAVRRVPACEMRARLRDNKKRK